MIPAAGNVRAWLGIQKDFTNKKWVRDDGKSLTYTHWKSGEGNDTLNEPAAAMVWQTHWYGMVPGTEVYYTICRLISVTEVTISSTRKIKYSFKHGALEK